MNSRRIFASFVLMTVVIGTSGCKLPGKKKATPPSQAQAPTLSPTQTATQNPGPPPPSTSEPARPMPTPGEVIVADVTPPQNLPKPPRTAPRRPPKKTIVENEPPAPAQPPTQPQGPVASISHDDALRQKLETAQLIETTESVLRGLNRQLSNNEQAMVQHIRSYIKDSQNATQNGDYERAHGLAVKAHLLSDELTKK